MKRVGGSDKADFKSIRGALAVAAPNDVIYIEDGIYDEQVVVDIPGITLVGESRERTVITGSLYGFMPRPDYGKLGTFRSYTVFVNADDVKLENLTIQNTAGEGPDIGQAIALYADGDRFKATDVSLLGHQDTLFTGPLPEREYEKHGFVGPKEFSPRTNTRQVYENCYIEGGIDFIFGSATAYFKNCTLFQNATPSYVTAASTPKDQKVGYVFDSCRFESNCPEASCYLGRPWREYACTVIMNSYIGSHIHPSFFDDWGKEGVTETVRFYVYGNFGPGQEKSSLPAWVKTLTEEEASEYVLM